MRRSAALVAMAASLLSPAAASAHTHLKDLRPQPEAVLRRPPDSVRLVFNQPVDVIARGTGIRDAAADLLLLGGGRQLVLRPHSALRAGRIDVRFRVLSKDGHVLRGRYGFTVRRGALPGEALQVAGADSSTSTAAAIVHGLHHLLFVLAVGLALTGPLVLGAAGVAFPAGALRAICLAGVVVSVLCASLTWLAADGGAVTRALLPGTIGDAAGTTAGAGWLLRAGLWLAAALAVRQRLLCGGVLAGIALSLALSGHAGTHGGAGGVPVDAVHVLAAGAWLGGLAVLAVAWRGDRAAATSAYGRIALLAFGALVVSGALNALLRVGSFDALVDRDYGRLVLAKTAIAAAVAVVAATAALRHRAVSASRLAAELGLGAGALTLAAILVETAPPT
jgi:copper transport protein